MHFSQHRFSRNNQEFYRTLRSRVSSYFEENNISKKGNSKMFMKTIAMILIFLVPFVVLLSGAVTATLPFLALWFVMGIGVAGIGLSVMHDANHGAYSNNETVNMVLGRLMDLIGGSTTIWKLQHNVLHHTYTNVDGVDHDLEAPLVLRFSPYQRHRTIHKYQHIHAWFFYQMLTLAKLFFTDFNQAIQYRKIGLVKSKEEFRKILTDVILWKFIYIAYIVVLPMILIPVSPWLVLGGFLIMHAVIGFTLSVIFQLAHVMPESEYPMPDANGGLEHDWAVHQLLTTANFANTNKLLTWYAGGLNFQIEHHLFSNICHIHYPDLSRIVKATAEEFGIPYRTRATFRAALADHARMLFMLGRPQLVPVQSNN